MAFQNPGQVPNLIVGKTIQARQTPTSYPVISLFSGVKPILAEYSGGGWADVALAYDSAEPSAAFYTAGKRLAFRENKGVDIDGNVLAYPLPYPQGTYYLRANDAGWLQPQMVNNYVTDPTWPLYYRVRDNKIEFTGGVKWNGIGSATPSAIAYLQSPLAYGTNNASGPGLTTPARNGSGWPIGDMQLYGSTDHWQMLVNARGGITPMWHNGDAIIPGNQTLFIKGFFSYD